MHQLLSEEDYDWSQAITAIQAPTLVVVGDTDGVRADHAIELLGPLRSGKDKDKGKDEIGGVQRAQLAVLPGTTHSMVMDRVEWLLSMLTTFLDAPMSMPLTG
jgi:pimeloyl-ACP methyl ester carboxylesterase